MQKVNAMLPPLILTTLIPEKTGISPKNRHVAGQRTENSLKNLPAGAGNGK